MTQHREPPAFQEYAATMMANIEFRTMSLAARGLLYTMRLECWVNRRLPADPARLARMLGFDAEEVTSLLPEVMGFFRRDSDYIVCTELDAYRTHLEVRSERQAEGGRNSAKRTNARRWGEALGSSSGDSSSSSSGECRVLSTEQPRPKQPNSAMKGLSPPSEMSEYEKLSRGS